MRRLLEAQGLFIGSLEVCRAHMRICLACLPVSTPSCLLAFYPSMAVRLSVCSCLSLCVFLLCVSMMHMKNTRAAQSRYSDMLLLNQIVTLHRDLVARVVSVT